jgi:hypothetical protein
VEAVAAAAAAVGGSVYGSRMDSGGGGMLADGMRVASHSAQAPDSAVFRNPHRGVESARYTLHLNFLNSYPWKRM